MRAAGHDRTLWQVTAPHFCAGLILTGDTCTEVAPILRWCRGKGRDELRRYFAKRGWQVRFVARLAEYYKM